MVDVQSPELGFSNTKSCISIAVIINPWVMCQETLAVTLIYLIPSWEKP